MSILHGYIWKIRDDQVESFRNILEQIALRQLNPFGQSKAFRVFASERQRVFRNIHCVNLCFRKFLGETERDHSTPRSNIDNTDLWPLTSDLCFEQLDEFLGFRPRHHRAFVAKKRLTAKFHCAKKMLERLRPFPGTNNVW